MTPKTALITGSTAGIGNATAKALAQKGWHVIIHGRKEQDGINTVKTLQALTGNDKIDYVPGDLSNLREVKSMAEEIKDRFPQLSVLVNNAGTFSTTRQLTADGLELTWVVNYLSRFLLTNLLLDTLKANAPSRIVDVSGTYHKKGKLHFEDLSLKHGYTMNKANSQAKLANVLFTYKLARLLEDSQVTSNTLHPGAVNTGSVLKAEGFSSFAKILYQLISPFFKTPEQGAATSVYLASSPDVEGVTGKYFKKKRAIPSINSSYDVGLQDRLWEESWGMVGEANRLIHTC